MIVLCSIHDKQYHVGTVYATTMQPIGKLPLVECLRPTRELVYGVKYQDRTGGWYEDGYRRLLAARWPAVTAWLASLSPDTHLTLVCFCKSGTFCHRSLIAKLLAKHRPDIDLTIL